MRTLVALFAALAAMLFVLPASAHKPSDSYLTLEIDGARVHGRWDIAARDLDYALDVDSDGDGKITWGELRERRAEIAEYALARLALQGCEAKATDALAIADHSDGAYAVLRFDAICKQSIERLGVDYHLFFDLDPQHRGLLRVDANGTSRSWTFSAASPSTEIDLADASRARQLGNAIREGVSHIWHGYDHLLFLFALLLPCVIRTSLKDVLRIVTAFTVAHSITLSLAAFDVVTLPSRLVESAIAASVVLAAINNLAPVLREERWTAAFLLGLMHGFGFSSTLKDLDLPRSNLLVTLFGFNAGVELGQLAIVAVFVPLAFAARRSFSYRRLVLVGGSIAILAVATVWLVERAFVVRILS